MTKTQSQIAEDKKDRKAQQKHDRPGKTAPMDPQPADKMEAYKPAGKFKDKVVLVTGGDSGIGRASAIGFAKEGASVAIMYLDETEDAEETKKYIEAAGQKCLPIKGDIGSEAFCKKSVEKVVKQFGRLDVLFNNAAEQHPQEDILDITEAQLVKTFRTNIFSMFFLTKAAMKHLKEGSSIVNTTSVTAYEGHEMLLDYSATKGAIVTFTRSLSQMLAPKKIRVNGVAPGPIWTPLIPSTFPPDKVKEFGKDTPLGRAGQPDEVAAAVLFLASDDASYITGQVIHPNGGRILNG